MYSKISHQAKGRRALTFASYIFYKQNQDSTVYRKPNYPRTGSDTPQHLNKHLFYRTRGTRVISPFERAGDTREFFRRYIIDLKNPHPRIWETEEARAFTRDLQQAEGKIRPPDYS